MSPEELANVWNAPAFLAYVHPPLTAARIEAAETQFGVTLPALYLDLLKVQNGGYLRGSWPEHRTHTVYGIGDGFPSLTDDGAWWRPRNTDPDDGVWAPEGAELLIPFDGDGHTNLCFDYRVVGPEGEPTITFVDCELATERPLTESFLTYLQGLEVEGGGVRLYGPNPEAAAAALAKVEGTEASEGTKFDFGFAIWKLPLADDKGWVLLRPNRVPAGYRREGRRVITTDETALRIPEDPSCTAEVYSWSLDEERLRGLAREALGDGVLVPS